MIVSVGSLDNLSRQSFQVLKIDYENHSIKTLIVQQYKSSISNLIQKVSMSDEDVVITIQQDNLVNIFLIEFPEEKVDLPFLA